MSVLDRKSLRDLWRHRGQALGVAVLVAIVTTLITGGVRTRNILEHTREAWYRDLALADLEIRVAPTTPGLAEAVAGVAGVEAADERLLVDGELVGPDGAVLHAWLQVLPPDRLPNVHRLRLVGGRAPAPGEAAALVDRSVVATTAIDVGDEVVVRVGEEERRLPVVGATLSPELVAYPVHPEYALPLRGTIAALSVTQAATAGIEDADRVNSVLVRAAPEADVHAVEEAVLAALPVPALAIVRPADRPGTKLTQMVIDTYDITMPYVAMVLVILALALVALTLSRLVMRQHRQLGTLKVLGHGRLGLARSFIAISTIPALLGIAIGLVVHAPVARYVFAGYELGMGYAPLRDPGPGIELPLTGLLCLLTGLLAGLVPVWSASWRRPARLLRPRALESARERQGPLVRIAARARDVLHLPLWVVLGLTHVARRRGATAVAVLGIAAVFAAMLALAINNRTQLHELLASIDRMGLDATVQLRRPAPVGEVEARGTDEIGVEPVVAGTMLLEAEGGAVVRRLVGAPPGRFLDALELERGRELAGPAARELLVDGWVADEQGVDVGDLVAAFPRPNAPEAEMLEVVGILRGVSLGLCVTGIETAQAVLGLPGQATAAQVASDLEPAELRRRLATWEDARTVSTRAGAAAAFRAGHEGTERIHLITLGLSILLAVVFLAVLAGLDATDRAGELALLQAVGWRDRTVLGMWVSEVSFRGVLALALAVPGALLLADLLLGRLAEANHYVARMQAPLSLFVLVLAVALVLLPLGAWPAWRASRRLMPARALRRITQD